LNAILNDLPAPTLPLHGSFSGHETFTFRYAWLKKGIDGLSRRPDIFQAEEAMVELGVGKNMVRSIRHWCLATRVLDEGDYLPGSRTRRLTPSDFGRALFIDPGYDPYLEDDASLWLLHWNLATNAGRASTWYWAFNLLRDQDFSRETLTAALARVVAEKNWSRVAEASLKADVACFLRTYASGKRGINSTLEETLDCPLTSLNLITSIEDEGRFRFVNGYKPSLPTAVFTYALLDFWRERFAGQETLSIRQIVYSEGSPGRVFRLDDDATLRHLDRLEEITDGRLRFSDTLQQRHVARHHSISGREVLDAYYSA
jgi:hypothetical protein